MKDLRYGNLHTHTEFSNLRLRDSVNRSSEVMLNAQEKGLVGVAFTDHESLSAHVEIEKARKELRDKGLLKGEDEFKVVLGNEIYLVDDREELRQKGRFPHFLLLAKNKQGHKALREMTNIAWTNMFVRNKMERVPIEKREVTEVMKNYEGDVVASTACIGSEFAQSLLDLITYELVLKHASKMPTEEFLRNSIEGQVVMLRFARFMPQVDNLKWEYYQLKENSDRTEEEDFRLEQVEKSILQNYMINLKKMGALEIHSKIKEKKREIHNLVTWSIETFGKENFFIEIQPSSNPEQILYNGSAINIAKAYELDWIVTTDAHFLNEEDLAFQEAFLRAQEGDREVASFYTSCYIHEGEQVVERLNQRELLESQGLEGISDEDIGLALSNTIKILDMCEEYSLEEKVRVPRIDVSDREIDLSIIKEKGKDKHYIQLMCNSDNVQDRYFMHLVQYGMTLKELEYTEERLDRIEIELKEIWEVGVQIEQNMAQYYVSAREFINIMWSDGDSLVGAARGSITGMFTAYLLDIVQVNPMTHDLPHWRLTVKTTSLYCEV